MTVLCERWRFGFRISAGSVEAVYKSALGTLFAAEQFAIGRCYDALKFCVRQGLVSSMENEATPVSPAAATCAQKSVCQSVMARFRTGVAASLICHVPSAPPDSEPLDVIVPAVLLFEVDNVKENSGVRATIVSTEQRSESRAYIFLGVI